LGFNNPLRYKRSEALRDVTVDLAKEVVVSDSVWPASLSGRFCTSPRLKVRRE
jgi:hypothetical protein